MLIFFLVDPAIKNDLESGLNDLKHMRLAQPLCLVAMCAVVHFHIAMYGPKAGFEICSEYIKKPMNLFEKITIRGKRLASFFYLKSDPDADAKAANSG